MKLSSLNNPTANQIADQVAGQERVIQNSLALKMLCQSLRADRNYAILDLGPAAKENVDFYSQYARKIHIADIYDSLSSPSPAAPGEANSKDTNIENILSCAENTRFDLIFAWDLFHYLPREQLQKLILQLKKFSNHEAVLYSLTTNNQYVPDKPIGFRILDKENLTYPPLANTSHPNARYREPNLSRLMTGFKVHKTFLLRNGMQEHLFHVQ